MIAAILRSQLLILLCAFFSPLTGFPVKDTTAVTNTPATPFHAPAFKSFDSLFIPEYLYYKDDPLVIPPPNVSDTLLEKRARAHALLKKVLERQRFLENLDSFSEIDLPLGIVKPGGSTDYSILIDRMRFTKEGALMDVYASLTLPQTGTAIAFYGEVPLSAEGGIAGTAKLFLLGDHTFKLNNVALVTLNGNDQSYVEFDCSGFLGINFSATLAFSSDTFIPENQEHADGNGRLNADFTTYVQSLHDIRAQVTLPPFQVKGLKGFGFHVTQAWLDWSDLSNPPGIVFPPGYTSPYIGGGLDHLWQGIYLQEMQVKLPPAFARRANTGRVAIGARQMIIDDAGLTGDLFVENVITDGDMRGWRYSLDLLSLSLINNQVSGFDLKGKLTIPVVKKSDGSPALFRYTAQRSATAAYIFSVQVEDALKLDLWMADLTLQSGSSVIVTERENKFYPSAHLSGDLTFNFIGKGPKATINSIRFEEMVISSEAPYFIPGTFGFGREGQHSSISKYPVVVDDISIKTEENRTGLAFDLTVNISGKPEDESFAGKGGLIVWGVQEGRAEENDKTDEAVDQYRWRFENLELTDLRISVHKPKIIDLEGNLRFFNDDETYGDGFKGSVKGTISSIKVEAEALFGRTDSYRYWYADALVEFKTGVPLIPGVLSAFGFGGGYYAHMKQGTSSGSVTLGRTPSGITYIPAENHTGIRAAVLIGTPRPEAMSGDVALEVSLNAYGGINSLTFTGNANFMSAPALGKSEIRQLAQAAIGGNLTEQLSDLSHGQVYGSMRLHFDHVNDAFHGNLEVYVNVAGGMVRGISDRNKAGWAVLHFEKNDWYIHIGTPDQPLGLEVARLFKSKSYFMLGKNLPGSPPPPSQVTEILGDIDLDYMRDLNALESGMGIAFGLHFLVDTGDLRFLMFYGRFSAGTGLDFMLKDYGDGYHCAGTGPIGINGWYANGQAYAFVKGKIGIKVDLRFYKGTYDILDIGAAAILQAKGPNPFWMKGVVGGYYKILGGLVKGKCRFEVTVGEACKPAREESLLADINFIAQVSPADNTKDVDVFNAPQVAFNIPVGEVFNIRDLENHMHSFRATLDEFVILNNDRPLPGHLTWNPTGDVVIFDADDILPGNQKIDARVSISFEEKRNGTWTKVKHRGQTVTESAKTTFHTGTEPDYIPEENVLLSYPQADQMNFHPAEYSRGFIQLRHGQPGLFKPDAAWTQKIRIREGSAGTFMYAFFQYDPAEKRIHFDLPAGFAKAKNYWLEIVNLPVHTAATDQNVEKVATELDVNPSGGKATLTTQSIEGYLTKHEESVLYKYRFRSSLYETFAAKMKATALSPAIRHTADVHVYSLSAYLQGNERLTANEASPGQFNFITTEAILEGNQWYERHVYPLVYEGYPLLGRMTLKNRNPAQLGIPPVRDIYMDNLRQGTLASGEAGSLMPYSNESLTYNLGESVARDFRDLQRQAANYIVDHPGPISRRIEALITDPMPYVRHGTYKVRMHYRIPGTDKITSSYELKLFNPVKDND